MWRARGSGRALSLAAMMMGGIGNNGRHGTAPRRTKGRTPRLLKSSRPPSAVVNDVLNFHARALRFGAQEEPRRAEPGASGAALLLSFRFTSTVRLRRPGSGTAVPYERTPARNEAHRPNCPPDGLGRHGTLDRTDCKRAGCFAAHSPVPLCGRTRMEAHQRRQLSANAGQLTTRKHPCHSPGVRGGASRNWAAA
jgi:hypothetical protein